MYFLTTINGNDVLLTPKQLERVVEVLADAEFVDRKYVGCAKGWWGADCEYEARFKPYDPQCRLPVHPLTQATYDKIATLIAMRDKERS